MSIFAQLLAALVLGISTLIPSADYSTVRETFKFLPEEQMSIAHFLEEEIELTINFDPAAEAEALFALLDEKDAEVQLTATALQEAMSLLAEKSAEESGATETEIDGAIQAMEVAQDAYELAVAKYNYVLYLIEAGPIADSINAYPLAGQEYEGYGDGVKNELYNAKWEADGFLWQYKLPEAKNRVWNAVSGTIMPGRYEFNGVSARLYLDEARNGEGSNNPETVAYGNALEFEVRTDDNGEAWFLIEGDNDPTTGASIQYLGPLEE